MCRLCSVQGSNRTCEEQASHASSILPEAKSPTFHCLVLLLKMSFPRRAEHAVLRGSRGGHSGQLSSGAVGGTHACLAHTRRRPPWTPCPLRSENRGEFPVCWALLPVHHRCAASLVPGCRAALPWGHGGCGGRETWAACSPPPASARTGVLREDLAPEPSAHLLSHKVIEVLRGRWRRRRSAGFAEALLGGWRLGPAPASTTPGCPRPPHLHPLCSSSSSTLCTSWCCLSPMCLRPC